MQDESELGLAHRYMKFESCCRSLLILVLQFLINVGLIEQGDIALHANKTGIHNKVQKQMLV